MNARACQLMFFLVITVLGMTLPIFFQTADSQIIKSTLEESQKTLAFKEEELQSLHQEIHKINQEIRKKEQRFSPSEKLPQFVAKIFHLARESSTKIKDVKIQRTESILMIDLEGAWNSCVQFLGALVDPVTDFYAREIVFHVSEDQEAVQGNILLVLKLDVP
ncbi:MAG: hypothetical protein NUV91_08035 [Candidatus Omnitrophica bacterium]|nr:hypothetical protein [Candidatus Omnitrophota bacterium]